MAKKKKRQVSSGASNVSSASKMKSVRVSKANEFNPDYTFVIKDLKRIGMLAVSFTAVLIVLSFVLG